MASEHETAEPTAEKHPQAGPVKQTEDWVWAMSTGW